MDINTQPTNGIRYIWATPVAHFRVKEGDQINQAFLPFLQRDDLFEKSWPLSPCTSSFTYWNTEKNGAFPWELFFSKVMPIFEQYIDQLGVRPGTEFAAIQYWVNRYFQHEFQEPHMHTAACFSLVYCIENSQVNGSGGDLVFDNTGMPWRSTPQHSADLLGNENLTSVVNPQQYSLQPGDLVIFPSWVTHYTTPTVTAERRSTIAVNFDVLPNER